MSKSNYRMDPQGLKKLANSPELEKALVSRAEAGLMKAKASAPRDTGDFVNSLQVRATKIKSGRRGEERSAAVIESTIPYGYAVGGKKPNHFMSQIPGFIEVKK